MQNKSYTLLVGVDFSESADRALKEAFAQASQRANAEVHVLSALPVASDDGRYAVSVYTASDVAPLLDTAIQRLRTHVEQQLQKFRLAHPDAPLGFRIVSHAHVATAAHSIVQLASDLSADLIVIGTHNPKGIERLLLGSVAESTVRNARCPVLVIPPPPQLGPEETITPACPECVQTRFASAGKDFWCAQHSERHGRRHTYHQADRSGGAANFPLVIQ
jgi:nucleotide-binding universal stress UspA family protein